MAIKHRHPVFPNQEDYFEQLHTISCSCIPILYQQTPHVRYRRMVSHIPHAVP